MNAFTWYTPTQVIFGPDAERQLGASVAALGKKKVMVVYGGGSAVKSGLLAKVESSLAEEGIEFISKGGVKPNPLLSFVEEALEEAGNAGVDFVVACGGGSVIDTAKAISMGLANPGVDLWDFFMKKKPLTASVGVGVVLTISAAGSEMSDSCVITRDDGLVKVGLSSDWNRPKFAIMNPENTFTLPPYQVACGVVDIMMHTLERYFGANTGNNELTDQMAEALLRTVIEHGMTAVEDSHDYQAMSELMWAGSLSHNGLTGLGAVGDFATHRLGHELSAQYGATHGASLAALWGTWARYVWRENPSRFVRYASNVWGIQAQDEESAAMAAIGATEDYFRQLGMPLSISGLGIGTLSEEELQLLADKCSRQGTITVGQFMVLDREDMYEIYKEANR